MKRCQLCRKLTRKTTKIKNIRNGNELLICPKCYKWMGFDKEDKDAERN